MTKSIKGSGGGGGGSSRTPVNAPESLRSREYARIVDLVSEGEIGGLVNGLKSVYIEGTPLQNDDGSYNFTGVSIVMREGTASQNYVPGFDYVENEVNVNVLIKNSAAVTRTLSNPVVDSARVRVSLAQLVEQKIDNGDSIGRSVSIAFDVKTGSGSFVEVLTDTITGKTTSKYVRQYAIPLAGSAPWTIRARRITADSVGSYIQDEIRFESYTEVIDVKLRRPNTAAVYFQADSSQFANIPSRSYKCTGKLIKIPSNYNPVTRTYTGIWNGTFIIAYSNNPAWIFNDLVISTRYGLAKYVNNAQLDKWKIYELGRYCDEMVPDGNGLYEPRFTLNIYIATPQQAYALLNDIASAFESMPSYSGDNLNLIQDAPRDVEWIYAPANVIAGKFNYSGISKEARHSAVHVTWNDPLNHYKKTIAQVVDDELVRKFGYKITQVTAVGCTSQGQAIRKGRRILYTEAVETELVSFEVGLDSLYVEAGSVFKIADPLKTANKRCGGRIMSGSTSAVLKVDKWADPGSTASITVMMPDGSLQKRNVASVVGNDVTLASTLTSTPVNGAMWVASGSTANERYWRCLSIEEKTGKDRITFGITALAHDPSKYAKIDDLGILITPVKPPLPTVAQPVTGIVFTESLVVVNNQAYIRVNVSWNNAYGSKSFVIRYKLDDGNLEQRETSLPSVDIDLLSTGTLYVSISAIGNLGIPSASTEASTVVLGESLGPQAPTNLMLEEEFSGSGVRFKWDSMLRTKGYEVRIKSGSTILRQVLVGDTNRFEYTGEFMQLDTAGSPVRSFTVEVRSIGYNDVPSLTWSSLGVANTAPAVPSNATFDSVPGSIVFKCNKPADRDFVGILLWMSNSSGFTPGAGNLVRDTLDIATIITKDVSGTSISTGATYYFKFAAYDTFGKSSLNISSEFAVTVSASTSGLQQASVELYQWYPTTPSNPAGTTNYDWATGANTSYSGPYWSTTILTNPGTAGLRLWVATKKLVATVGTTATTVDWSTGVAVAAYTVNGADGASGSSGTTGLQSAQAIIYRWDTGTPTGPTGSPTWTWSTSSFGSAPSGWQLLPGNPPSLGYTLYGAEVRVQDSAANTTTGFTWSSASITVRGYAGTNGTNGTNGSNGLNGTDGIAGTNGTNGLPVYFHLKWSNDGGATFTSSSGETPGDYLGSYSDNTPADSTSVGAYTWALVKGTDGTDGIAGTRGTDGLTPYLHIKYSNDGGATFTASAGETVGSYLGTYSDYTLADSTSVGSYTWAQIKGTDGTNGSNGQQGASARYCYQRVPGNPAPTSGFITTGGFSSFPASGDSNTYWGINQAWVGSDPNPSSTNTLYQADGIYDPATGNTVWSTPYISSLKVGSLSAITVNTGALTVTGNLTVTSGAVLGGAFTGFSWPAAGAGGGFYLGPNGALFGSVNDSDYLQLSATGALYSRQFSIVGGAATFSGTLSAATGTFAGSLSAATGTFSGTLSAATGTFAGSLSAATGTFAGSLSAATGTFAGSLSAVTGSFGSITLTGLLLSAGKASYDTGNGVMIGVFSGNSYLGITREVSGVVKGMWISSSDGILHISGAVITESSIALPAYYVSLSAYSYLYQTYSYGTGYATITATASGGSGSGYTYVWSITKYAPNADASVDIVSVGSNSVYVQAHVGGAGSDASGIVTCTATDSAGRITTASFTLTAGSTA